MATINWITTMHMPNGFGKIKIIDPDQTDDTFLINISSDSFTEGLEIDMKQDPPDNSIFVGTVNFTDGKFSSSSLYAQEGDGLTAKYMQRNGDVISSSSVMATFCLPIKHIIPYEFFITDVSDTRITCVSSNQDIVINQELKNTSKKPQKFIAKLYVVDPNTENNIFSCISPLNVIEKEDSLTLRFSWNTQNHDKVVAIIHILNPKNDSEMIAPEISMRIDIV